MVVSDLDNVNNLHLVVPILQAKILVSLMESLTEPNYKFAIKEIKKVGIELKPADAVAVVQQALLTMKGFTNMVGARCEHQGEGSTGESKPFLVQ